MATEGGLFVTTVLPSYVKFGHSTPCSKSTFTHARHPLLIDKKWIEEPKGLLGYKNTICFQFQSSG